MLSNECVTVPHFSDGEVIANDPELLRDLYASQMRAYLLRELYDRRQELSAEVAILKQQAEQYRHILNTPIVRAQVSQRRAAYEERVKQRNVKLSISERMARLEAEKRRGYVYILKTFAGLYKIGKSRDLKRRLEGFSALGKGAFECVHVIKCENCHDAEQVVHSIFAAGRVERELFRLSDEQVGWLLSIKTSSEGCEELRQAPW